MSSERAASVAIIWIVALVVLLLGREFARGSGRFDARAMRAMNVLVVVMVVAVGGIGVLVGASLLAGDRQVATSPTPDVSPSPSGPVPTPTERPTPSATLEPPTSPPATSSPSGESPSPDASPTIGPSPTPSAAPTVSPSEAGVVRVEAGPSLRTYEVDGPRVTSFDDIRITGVLRAHATSPATYEFPSLSDPAGTVQLIQVVDGPFAGIYLSPDDAGVSIQTP